MKVAKFVRLLLVTLAIAALAAGCATVRERGDRGATPAGTAHGQAATAPERMRLDILAGHRLGNPKASLVVVEFSDFQCPFCRRYHDGAFQEIKQNFVDTGIVQYVVWDFPLNIHRYAPGAAVAADCAEEQGKYWRMRDRLFANQGRLGRSLYVELAKELGLDTAKFNACLDSSATFDKLRRSMAFGNMLGINATPTILIGRVKDGRVHIEREAVGAPDYEQFASEIKKLRH